MAIGVGVTTGGRNPRRFFTCVRGWLACGLPFAIVAAGCSGGSDEDMAGDDDVRQSRACSNDLGCTDGWICESAECVERECWTGDDCPSRDGQPPKCYVGRCGPCMPAGAGQSECAYGCVTCAENEFCDLHLGCLKREACCYFSGFCSDIRECGPDQLGGPSCGECTSGTTCNNGLCGDPEACSGRSCGPDGLGGQCGFCDEHDNSKCSDGQCDCKPYCPSGGCGDDGCGGDCGPCPPGRMCVGTHCKCDCSDVSCGYDPRAG